MKPNLKEKKSIRRNVSIFVMLVGAVVLFSSFAINPLVGRWIWGERVINREIALQTYFIWSLGIGAIIISMGFAVRHRIADNVVMLGFMVFLFVLSDRLLLVKYGLPLWIADSAVFYKHRPNIRKRMGPDFDNKVIRINKYGQHDDNFPQQKRQDEFRALMIGDSITMGDGLTFSEAFPNQLEKMLTDNDSRYEAHQVINAGVQGYTTYQEYQTLKESMVFDPDFIAVGFCMNDITEPLRVDQKYGGTGVDYHGIIQTNSIFFSYFLNETGYGRLINKLQKRKKSAKAEKLQERYNVKRMALHSANDPKIQQAWKNVLNDLSGIYEFAKEYDRAVVLLIFPYTFQFFSDDAKTPQEILIEHAYQHNVDVIDFTQIFQDIICEDGKVVSYLKQNGFLLEEIEALYQKRLKKYFMDELHCTVEGYRIVALKLFEYLAKKGFVKPQ